VVSALTTISVEKAQGKAARYERPDGRLSGLYLIVQPSGAKSWCVRYRIAGKPQKLTLGGYPAIDLVAARKLAGEALRAVAEGRNPGAERHAARRKAVEDGADTIEDVALKFLERHAKRHTRESSWRETARILGFAVDPADAAKLVRSASGGDVLRKWKGKTIHAVKRCDVIELLDGIVDRGSPVAANRVLAATRKMFAWAVSRDMLAASPCAGVKAPAPETSRDRVLSDDELRAVWRAGDAIGYPFGPLVKLLILTGQRRDEVAAMRWSELDMAARTWTLPRERTKTDKSHTVPLSDAVVVVLENLPRIAGAGYVFTTNGSTPVSGFSRAKRRIDDIVAQALGSAPPQWVLHDLRRTCATGMARLGVDLPVIEKVLNHVSGSFAGIVGVYQHHSYADKVRTALDVWGRHASSQTSDEPAESNIIALRTAGASA
jgi:integrase